MAQGTGTVSRVGAGAPVSEPDAFANAMFAFLATARRTRGRLQPGFDDITVPQLVLLAAVQACGSEGVGAVAEHTGLAQPTVTRGIAGLERDGLVTRLPGDGDRRTRVLALTSRGEEVLAEKREFVAERLRQAWERLDGAEQALVVPLLHHLVEVVEDLF